MTENPMQLAQSPHIPGGDALGRFGALNAGSGSAVPRDVLSRLAKTIQLMRLDHVDAHLYRNGCDALVRSALEGSTASELEVALTDVMRHVEDGDYHWALMELRALTQLERAAC